MTTGAKQTEQARNATAGTGCSAGRWLLLLALAGARPLAASAADSAPSMTAKLEANGRSFSVSAAGMTEFCAGWSATIERGQQRSVLSSLDGVCDGAAIRFAESGVDLLFRFETPAGAPAVLAQAGIRNTGKEPVRLVEISPVEAGFRVAGDAAEWLVTRLDTSVETAPPVAALSELAAPHTVHEYGGLYRQDGVGFLFGPAGAPLAYVSARIRHAGAGRVTFSLAADMSGVRVDPGRTRWGQQVTLLLEPPSLALPRWAEWVAQSHGARTGKPALTGWSSGVVQPGADAAQVLLQVVGAVQRSGDRLRPTVVQMDRDFGSLADRLIEATNALPELTTYAQRIAATGARPGLLLEFSEVNYPGEAPPPAAVVQSLRRAVQTGFTYLKLSYPLAGSHRGETQTSFEAVREEYAAIRKAIGEDVYLLDCDRAPNRAVVGWADASRTGTNALRDRVTQAPADVLRSYALQERWFTVDNDGYYLGTDDRMAGRIAGDWPFARTWMSMVGLSCGTAMASDPWHWFSFRPYWRNIEVMTPPARERTEVPDLGLRRDWPRLVGHVERPWGEWTVALLWNPSATGQTVTLDFAQAGLDPHRRYAVWSFWDNRYLGVARGQWTTPRLAPLSCQQVCLTDLDRFPSKPVLIGSNLHIYNGAAELERVTALTTGMEIELTDAGARDGDLLVYSRHPPALGRVTGCRVAGIADGGENVWRIALQDRQRGSPQRIELLINVPLARQAWFWLLIATAAASAGLAGWWYVDSVRVRHRQSLTEERARIARDLHDEIGSQLARLSMLGEMAGDELAESPEDRRRVQELTRGIREAAGDLERVIWSLNPRHDRLDEVADRVCKEAEDFFSDTPVQCRFTCMPALPPLAVQPGARAALLKVVKEASANILKHAGATAAELTLRVDCAVLEVRVADNGCGFDPGQPAPTAGGNGLANMRARMSGLGGECRLESAPGQGTTVILRVPLDKTASKG